MTRRQTPPEPSFMRQLAARRRDTDPPRERTRHDHNHFAERRRDNMAPGETLASARDRWRAAGLCRDCGGAIDDGAAGRRCRRCRKGANRRKPR